MVSPLLGEGVKDKTVHMVGAKGVGMTALAEILSRRGARLSGSDTPEVFFTDEILGRLGMRLTEGFNEDAVTPAVDLVIYSAAYAPATNPELKKAAALHVPCLVYPAALGELSRGYSSAGVSGVHGKTTTSALVGALVKALSLPATVLVGSQVPGLDNRFTYGGGDRYLVAETCEYQRHFLYFHPARIIMTSIEADHQDYFRDLDDLYDAFTEYGLRLPPEGALIHCADDPGVGEVVSRLRARRPDIRYIPYGSAAAGPWRVTNLRCEPGASFFRLSGFSHEFVLRLPGRHMVLNAAAALALTADLAADAGRALGPAELDRVKEALAGFTGTRRRSEILGEAGGVLFMDDYAHHPTAIRLTLEGLKRFYPDRRLVVDFMSHTYSRTAALLEDFASSFTAADHVILHKIYASARETFDGTVSGETLFERTRSRHPSVLYFPETSDAVPYLAEHLGPGDLFVTMGAGDNWKLGRDLYHTFTHKGAPA